MLHLSPTPLTLWIGIIGIVLTAVLCVVSWRRSPHRGRTGVLECLRLLAATAAAILLWQPEWRAVINPDTKPRIAILWDDSKSMTTDDAQLPLALSDTPAVVSRAEWVRRALEADLWQPLEANGANELLVRPFATPSEDDPALSGTDLDEPLTTLLEDESNLRAIIVLSDGDYNLGQPPVAAAQKARLRGVPVFPIPVGSKTRLPDIDILSVSPPTYGIVGENVQIPFAIRSSLNRQVRTVVRLRDDSGRERTRDLILPPNTEVYDSVLWRLEQEGASTIEISIPVADGELVASNNSRKFVIQAKPERIRVLVVETLPRWEYRFLHNALSRDPGVDIKCLLLHPQLGPAKGGHFLEKFPEKLEELAEFDVIFLGDVGVGQGQLTREDCALIRGLVENQASGVVFLPGPQGNQATLMDTDLADLFPVILDDGKRTGTNEEIASPLQLTTEGRKSLLTMLGNSEEENPEIWRRLPGFFWFGPVLRAKAGTEVLAVHGNRRNKFGPVPLIVTKPAGTGKVLYMGIDSAWRWRRGVEDLYHYRFWGQVARWMSYQRNMAAGQRVRLFFSPERPLPGTQVTLNANAFDPNGAPLQEGSVAVDITAPDGRTQRIDLQKNESAWGAFSGRFKVDLPGTWKLRATSSGAEDKPVETSLIAQGVDLEKTGQPARPEVLEEIARVSRGRLIQPSVLPELIKEITALPEPRPLEKRLPLWTDWRVIAGFIGLLAVFWTGRKLNGMF